MKRKNLTRAAGAVISALAASFLIAAPPLLLAGCGGGGNGLPGSGGSTATRARGQATVSVTWPERTRLVPDASNSIVITLVKTGTPLVGAAPAPKTLTRPAAGQPLTTTAQFDNLELGTYTVSAVAYPTTDGSGVAQARKANVPINVVDGQNAAVPLTMDSTIDRIEITTPVTGNLRVGDTRDLFVVAKDASGAVVITSPRKITWTPLSSPVATLVVSATESKATATIVGVGTVVITATDTESGKSGTITLTAVVVGLGETAWPKFHGDAQNTGQAKTGSPTTGVGTTLFTARNAIIFSSPAVGADGTVYVGSYDNNLYALNPATPGGVPKWAAPTGGNIESSPAIGKDGTVYVGSLDGKLYAFNGQTGAKVWEFAASGPIFASPAVSANGYIFVGATTISGVGGSDRRFYCVDALTGLKVWEFTAGDGIQSSAALSLDGATVYFGSLDGKVYALNAATGASRPGWPFSTGGPIVFSSPAVGADGTVYVGSQDGRMYAISAGGTQRWQYDAGAPIYSSPAINGANGTVYFGTFDNVAVPSASQVIALDGATGGETWTFPVDATITSSPAVGADGTVYIGTYYNAATDNDTVLALNGNGTFKWGAKTRDDVQSSPAIGADGVVYVGGFDNNVYAFR